MTLEDDPRWRRFNDRNFKCPCCGRSFQGVIDIAYDHPDPWPHGNRAAAGVDDLIVGDDRLSSDFCRVNGDYFVRGIMPFAIIGTDQTFAFGVWGSVTEENFKIFMNAFDTNNFGDFEGCFSWLSNTIPHVGQEDWVPCSLVVEDPTKRPVFYAQAKAEAVRSFQVNGITFDQLLDIYASVGQDIRPHLMDA